MTNRREFLKKAGIGGLLTALVPTWIEAKSLDSPIDKQNTRVMRIAHITDVHILDRQNAETCFSRVFQEINSMKDKPDMIINTGDKVMDENHQLLETVDTRWKVWNKISKNENGLPMHSALGNHDVWYGPDEKSDAEYK